MISILPHISKEHYTYFPLWLLQCISFHYYLEFTESAVFTFNISSVCIKVQTSIGTER